MKKLAFILFLNLWIIIIIISILWNFFSIEENVFRLAENKCSSFFEEIETTRLWNALHGGVYVTITKETQPNKYLKIKNRDIITIDSIKLTKINPAFMTRQIAKLAKKHNDIQYHITSLKPIRPENKADLWETKVLKSFKKKTDKILEISKYKGLEAYRYMKPLMIKKSCLKCHGEQGYKIGDVRGGISVTMPVNFYKKTEKKQKTKIFIFHFFTMIIGVIGIFFFKKLSNKYILILQKKNEEMKIVNENLNISNEELRTQQEEILKQKNKILFQKEQISKSIYYAKNIQKAIMPYRNEMNKNFKIFILYRPKDIVSGDFYFFTEIKQKNKNSYFFYSVIDCSGHGVPGAFMSMIANTLLKEIIINNKIYEPNEIFNIMNKEVGNILRQKISGNKDGMDIVMCRMEKVFSENNQNYKVNIAFAGAKRPLFIYNENSKKLNIIKGDRYSIGGRFTKKIEFKTKNIILNKNDKIFLTSDGLIDQKGEITKKRFGRLRFIETIIKTNNENIEKQGEEIEKIFDNFKKNENQRDDICLIIVHL